MNVVDPMSGLIRNGKIVFDKYCRGLYRHRFPKYRLASQPGRRVWRNNAPRPHVIPPEPSGTPPRGLEKADFPNSGIGL
jgi:hypothetical protein